MKYKIPRWNSCNWKGHQPELSETGEFVMIDDLDMVKAFIETVASEDIGERSAAIVARHLLETLP